MDNFVDLVVLLSVAVVVVALFERLKMPSIIAYLYVGLAVGPHGLGLIQDAESIRLLGGVGLIFFLFTAGLELPIPKIMAMGWISLGLGGGQVLLTMIAVAIVAFVFGFSWIEGIVIGSAMASSATALVIKQLKDQNELEEKHARISMVVTVFQDVLSIPILVLIPVLALEGGGSLAVPVFWVIVRILLVFSIFFILGRMFLRPLFHEIASTQSTELFTLTVLLVIALSAWVSHVADLSLVLGTFLAGMVLGETEFRHQVESDIRPFQDVLLGLFFITIGMLLDITLVFKEWQIIMMVSFAFMVAKGGIVALLMYLGKIGTRVESVRAGILLCQGSEFGFAVMLLAISNNILNERTSQIVLASLLITMVVSPVLIRFNGKIAPFVLRLLRLNDVRAPERESVRDEFASGIRRAKDHALILGYGPSGQNLARILEMEGVPYVASDLDPERVAQARAAGQMVMFGDASRTSILEIMSLDKAKLVVITMDHPEHVTRAIRNVRSLRPDVPICVRAKEDIHIDKFQREGATEVVPENLEASLMLTSHCLSLLGVPMSKVMRYTREARKDGYRILRGFFHGQNRALFDQPERFREQLKTVVLVEGAYAVDRALEELGLDQFRVSVTAIRRKSIRVPDPAPEVILRNADVLVLFGAPEDLERAESVVLSGIS